MVRVLTSIVISQCLDNTAFANPTMPTGIDHSLQFDMKVCELANTSIDLTHVTTRDAVGFRA
jgi:hypothetical protein